MATAEPAGPAEGKDESTQGTILLRARQAFSLARGGTPALIDVLHRRSSSNARHQPVPTRAQAKHVPAPYQSGPHCCAPLQPKPLPAPHHHLSHVTPCPSPQQNSHPPHSPPYLGRTAPTGSAVGPLPINLSTAAAQSTHQTPNPHRIGAPRTPAVAARGGTALLPRLPHKNTEAAMPAGQPPVEAMPVGHPLVEATKANRSRPLPL